MKKYLLFLSAFLLVVSCTSKPEEQVGKVIDQTMSPGELRTYLKKDFEKIFGKEETKFSKSVSDFIVSRFKYSYSDIKIDGDKATAKIKITCAKPEDIVGLVMLASLVDPQKLKEQTLQEFVTERASSKKQTANINDIKDVAYESEMEIKKINNEWKAEEGALDKVMLQKKAADATK